MKRDELELLIKNGFLQSKPDESISSELLGNLVNHGFLEELPNQFFSFHNNLTWEVIYETLLYAEKRLLHNIIALHIEKHNEENLTTVADILLYHFEKGINFPKCVMYGAMAGDNAASLFANEDAISFYNRAIAALGNIKRNVNIESCLLYEHIGDVYEQSGNHSQALRNYQTTLAMWETTSKRGKPKYLPWKLLPSTYEAYIARKIAMSAEHNAEYDLALEWLDKAEKLLPSRPGKLASQIAATRSASLYRKGEFKDAIFWGEQALKLAKRSKDKQDIAYAHNMIANPSMETGELSKAIAHLRSAEEICIETENFPGIASASHNLGNSYYAIGRLRDAISHFEKALHADELMHNASGITMSRFNLGNILVDTGNIEDSIIHLNFVLDEYQKGKSRRDLASASHMILSRAYRLCNNYDLATMHIKKCMEMLESDTQSGVYVYAELQYAELLLAQNDTPKALEISERILSLAKKQDAKLLEIQASRVFGQSKAQMREYDSAISCIKQSIDLAHSMGIEHEEALSIIAYAQVADTSNNITPETLKFLHSAIKILTKIGAKRDLEQAKTLAASLH